MVRAVFNKSGIVLEEYWLDAIESHHVPQSFNNFFAGVVVIVAIVAILGNGILIYVNTRSRKLLTANCYVVSVAISDAAMAASTYWMFVISSVNGVWSFSGRACNFYAYMQGVCSILSVVTLAAISAERFYAVEHPLASLQRSLKSKLKIVAALWVYCFFLCSPPLYGWSRYTPAGLLTTCCFEFLSHEEGVLSYILFLSFFGFVLPCVVICYCYGRMLRLLQKTIFEKEEEEEERNIADSQPMAIAIDSVVAKPNDGNGKGPSGEKGPAILNTSSEQALITIEDVGTKKKVSMQGRAVEVSVTIDDGPGTSGIKKSDTTADKTVGQNINNKDGTIGRKINTGTRTNQRQQIGKTPGARILPRKKRPLHRQGSTTAFLIASVMPQSLGAAAVSGCSSPARSKTSMVENLQNMSKGLRAKARQRSLILEDELRAAKVIALAIIAFLVAWLPYSSLVFISQLFGGGAKGGVMMVHPMIVHCLSVFAKTCVLFNPIIYSLKDEPFRRAVKKFVLSLCYKPYQHIRLSTRRGRRSSDRRKILRSSSNLSNGNRRGGIRWRSSEPNTQVVSGKSAGKTGSKSHGRGTGQAQQSKPGGVKKLPAGSLAKTTRPATNGKMGGPKGSKGPQKSLTTPQKKTQTLTKGVTLTKAPNKATIRSKTIEIQQRTAAIKKSAAPNIPSGSASNPQAPPRKKKSNTKPKPVPTTTEKQVPKGLAPVQKLEKTPSNVPSSKADKQEKPKAGQTKQPDAECTQRKVASAVKSDSTVAMKDQLADVVGGKNPGAKKPELPPKKSKPTHIDKIEKPGEGVGSSKIPVGQQLVTGEQKGHKVIGQSKSDVVKSKDGRVEKKDEGAKPKGHIDQTTGENVHLIGNADKSKDGSVQMKGNSVASRGSSVRAKKKSVNRKNKLAKSKSDNVPSKGNTDTYTVDIVKSVSGEKELLNIYEIVAEKPIKQSKASSIASSKRTSLSKDDSTLSTLPTSNSTSRLVVEVGGSSESKSAVSTRTTSRSSSVKSRSTVVSSKAASKRKTQMRNSPRPPIAPPPPPSLPLAPPPPPPLPLKPIALKVPNSATADNAKMTKSTSGKQDPEHGGSITKKGALKLAPPPVQIKSIKAERIVPSSPNIYKASALLGEEVAKVAAARIWKTQQ